MPSQIRVLDEDGGIIALTGAIAALVTDERAVA
jgi:hypothetical protein